MLEPETQVCGAVVIFDMDGLSLSQTTKFTPAFAKRIVDWLQVCTIKFYKVHLHKMEMFYSIHMNNS